MTLKLHKQRKRPQLTLRSRLILMLRLLRKRQRTSKRPKKTRQLMLQSNKFLLLLEVTRKWSQLMIQRRHNQLLKLQLRSLLMANPPLMTRRRPNLSLRTAKPRISQLRQLQSLLSE